MATGPELISALAQRLGLPSLTPDETGLYALRIDAELPVFIQAGDEDTGIVLFAGIGSIPPEGAGGACRALLEANNFWLATGGFTLSLIPGTLNVLLGGRAPLAELDGSALFALFDRFVTAATSWRQRLPAIVDESAIEPIVKPTNGHAGMPARMPGPGDLA
jgi:hypothetical protein